jgi:hypothetical protein
LTSTSSPTDRDSETSPTRFLLAVIAVDGFAAATPGEMTAINAFNDQLDRQGKSLLAIGLAGPRDSWVVDNRDNAGITAEGSAVDSEEYMAGMWLIEAMDMNEAREIAATASKACNRRIEVRAVH